jgi:hypothetical protein
MGLVERFTRDEASKYVWSVMALLAIAGLAFAVTSGGDALADERSASQSRALGYVQQVLEPRLESSDLVAPITGQSAASLEAAVERTVLVDERVSRVRIWSTEGTLLFSTDREDSPGSNAGLNDAVLRRAAREGVLTRSNISDTGGESDPERSLLRTYASLGTTAVAEIDQTDEGTLAALRTEWRSYQILAGALIVVFLVMTMLSLREPIEPINTGVPFAASSIPAGFSLIDDDRLHAVHEVYRLASERVARLQEKLEESENARRRLEGDIQRALSHATVSGPATPAAATATPATAHPQPAVVHVPESDVVEPPLGDAWVAAPAGPLARASRDQKPPPTTARKVKPAAEKRPRVPRRRKAKAEKPKPAVAPREAPALAPREAPTVAQREEPTVAPRETPPRAAPPPAPPSVQAPASERKVAAVAANVAPAPEAAGPISVEDEIDDAKAHEAALETFIRLTESDRQPHGTADVDQGAVRAALARTAARKKPGGERLQPHEGGHPEESAGRSPRRS